MNFTALNRVGCSRRGFFSACLLGWLCLMPVVAHAQYYYVTNNGESITITGYADLWPPSTINIPDTIDGLPVTGIGPNTFGGGFEDPIYLITIPSTVTNIGLGAFTGEIYEIVVDPLNPAFCSLNGVLFDKNRTLLIQCPKFKEGIYVIPSTVTSIGVVAFEDTSLSAINIPAGVTNIGNRAFNWGRGSLTTFTVDPANEFFSSLDGVLFDKSQTTLLRYPCGKSGHYAMPFGVLSIAQEAFFCAHLLTSITLPDTLTDIGDGAFNFSGLTNITIPLGVTNIGRSALAAWSLGWIEVEARNQVYSSFDGVLFNKDQTILLKCPMDRREGSYTIPGSVLRVGEHAFANCTYLTNVTITAPGVQHTGMVLEDYAFWDLWRMTNITIPEGVVSIGEWTFAHCGLTNIFIPKTVTNIGKCAFFCEWRRLKSIEVDALNLSYSSLDGVLFDKSRQTLVACPGGKAGNYVVPKGVQTIAMRAFYWCQELESITIPNTVTSIDDFAFEQSIVRGVYFEGNAPGLGRNPFFYWVDDPMNAAIVYYLPGTMGWGTNFGGRPTVFWERPNPVILDDGPGFGVRSNGFGFRISWATNVSVEVQACNDLGAGWQSVSTNTISIGVNAETDGWSDFVDPDWDNSAQRFYRVRCR